MSSWSLRSWPPAGRPGGSRQNKRFRPGSDPCALEARQVPALVVLPLTATPGITVSGTLAQFNKADLGDVKSDAITATIGWGDQTSDPGLVKVDPSDPNTLNVMASHTYSRELSGSLVVTIASPNGTPRSLTSKAMVTVGSPLVANPTVFTADQGKSATFVVATFTDPSNPKPSESAYGALIRWATDGRSSVGTIAFDGSGVARVLGQNTFLTATDTPVAVTIIRSSDGATASVTSTAKVANESIFGGSISPADLRSSDVIGNNRPTVVGTAPKRSIVRVSAVGPGNVGVLLLGQTVADNAGNWNLQTRPLPDGPYVFTATINPPGQFPARSILLTNNGRFVVDTIGPRIVSVGVESVDIQADPTSANLILNLSDVGSGVSVAAAMNSGAYAVTASVRKARQAVLIGPQAVLSVDAVGGNATNVRVAMRFEGLRPNVRYRLHLAPGLIVDRAGNALLGASTIDFRVPRFAKKA